MTFYYELTATAEGRTARRELVIEPRDHALLEKLDDLAHELGVPEDELVGQLYRCELAGSTGFATLVLADIRASNLRDNLRKGVAHRNARRFEDLAHAASGHFGAYAREQKPYRLTDSYEAEAILDELQAHFKLSRFEVFEALKVLAERRGGIYITVYETRPQIACHISADRLRGVDKAAGPESEDADPDKPERPVEDVK